MKNSTQIKIFSPSGCMSADGMSKAAAGNLDKSEAAAVQNHLAGCILCREAMQGVTKLGSAAASLDYHIADIRSRVRKTYPRENVFNTPLYYAAAATVALVITVSLVVWYPFNKTELAVNKMPEKSSIPSMDVPVQEKDKPKEEISNSRKNQSPPSAESESKDEGQHMINMDDLASPVTTTTASPAGQGGGISTNEITGNRNRNLFAESLDKEKKESDAGGGVSPAISYSVNSAAGGASAKKARSEVKSAKSDTRAAYRVKGKYDHLYSQDFSVVEEAPKFDGGENGLYKYIKRHVNYPNKAIEHKIEGKVIVQFVVCETGSIADAKVVQGVHPLLDQEALKVISNLPKWEPGKVGGIPVRVNYIIPVEFIAPEK